jgi:D-galactarolactone cycloisomerase
MASTHQGRAITSVETFLLRHKLDPRTGPSIALSDEHAYVLVKMTDADGRAGWGETYLVPGLVPMLDEVGPLVIGRPATALRELVDAIRWSLRHPYAASALIIALEDLRARQLGCSVAETYGGASRTRARAYAASGGYIEHVDPRDTWPREVERIREAGFTALKMRVGRYPIPHEAPLLEQLRAAHPAPFDFMADGNAAYTLPESVKMGRVLERLGYVWFEEPMRQFDNYAGYPRLAAALDVALAGGEGLENRADALEFLKRAPVDIIQPEPVIIGGIGETLWVADLADLHAITAMPHTSNNGIGIAAALQVLAVLPNPTRSPSSAEPFIEFGVDDNPNRTGILATPFEFHDGWITIPNGPGLGVEVDEDYVRRNAVDARVATPA